MAFIMLRYVSSSWFFWRDFFNHKWVLNLIKKSLCIYWDDHVFIFQFVNMVYHIDRFAYIKVSLHPWNKPHLIMVVVVVVVVVFCLAMSDSLQPHGLQHARLLCPSPSPRGCSNWCPLRRWCHPTITSSVIPVFSCLQSFPASGAFLTSQLFTSYG